MIFILSIAIPAWYFFYLDLSFTLLLVGAACSTGLWLLYRHAFIHFEGASDNPVVVLGMTTGGFGMLFGLVSIILMKM